MVNQTLLPTGILYVVATPIGNLEDITLRALHVFSDVKAILAEDTRHTEKMLRHYNIKTPLISYHAHNETERAQEILLRLSKGDSIALVSDAGTPLISDPGYEIVALARENGIQVLTVPGPCAAIAALSICGLPCNHFSFEGFLPSKKSAKLNFLKQLCDETRTMVFYESPHRIVETLECLVQTMGEKRMAAVSRELTKVFETTKMGVLQDLFEEFKERSSECRGEFVVIIAGSGKASLASDKVEVVVAELLQELLAEMPLKKAVRMAEKITQGNKNQLYALALSLSDSKKVI